MKESEKKYISKKVTRTFLSFFTFSVQNNVAIRTTLAFRFRFLKSQVNLPIVSGQLVQTVLLLAIQDSFTYVEQNFWQK